MNRCIEAVIWTKAAQVCEEAGAEFGQLWVQGETVSRTDIEAVKEKRRARRSPSSARP